MTARSVAHSKRPADLPRLLLVGPSEVCVPLGDALAGVYACERVAGVPAAIARLKRRVCHAVLIEVSALRAVPTEVRSALGWSLSETPLILLTLSHEPAPHDLVREMHAYHALPYTDRSWSYVARSITDVLGQRDLERENGFLRKVVENASDCILALEPSGRVALCNGAVVRTFGYSRSEILGKSLKRLFPPEREGEEGGIYEALRTREPWSGDVMARRRDGASFPVHVAVSFARGAGGEVTAAVVVARDVTELQRLLGRLTQMSIMDELTGVYNVRYFWARFHYELQRSRRYEQPLSVLMLDLDRFKLVNETHGHQVGDRVLHHVASILQRATREVDIVARYGGEEFAVILPSTPLEGALQCAEKLRRKVERSRLRSGRHTVPITVSVGAAALDPAVHSADALLRRADEALFEAKRLGRNRVEAWKSAIAHTA